MVLFAAYAPHSGKPYLERQVFFNDLSDFVSKTSAHGPKIICGDLNARIYRRLPGEEQIMGTHIFENKAVQIKPDANRHLLVELCSGLEMVVSNTFHEQPAPLTQMRGNSPRYFLFQTTWFDPNYWSPNNLKPTSLFQTLTICLSQMIICKSCDSLLMNSYLLRPTFLV